MDRIISSEKACHWYLSSGQPFFEVPNKSKPGEMRPANITDARKAGAVPSVTTILRVLAKPGLESWRQEQAILAALTLPHRDGESLEDFAHRVAEDAQQEGAKAAEEGTRIHDLVANYAVTRTADVLPVADVQRDLQFIRAYDQFQEQTNLVIPRCEVSFACADYGGRIDLLYSEAVVDIKTVTSKPGKPLPRYDEWVLQLTAYDEGLPTGNGKARRLINLVLSRNEPGRWEAVEYDNADVKPFEAWWHAVGLWKFINHWEG